MLALAVLAGCGGSSSSNPPIGSTSHCIKLLRDPAHALGAPPAAVVGECMRGPPSKLEDAALRDLHR